MKFSAFHVDDHFVTESILVKEEEMIDYAKKYDPQYLHLDKKAAKEGPFGTLIASGFYTLNIVWATFIQMDILGRECMGGLGADHIKWKEPVVGNDRLVGEFKVVERRMLGDKKRGIVTMYATVKNQDLAEVLTFTFKVLIAA